MLLDWAKSFFVKGSPAYIDRTQQNGPNDPREFRYESEAHEYGKYHYDEWADRLSHRHKTAVEAYKGAEGLDAAAHSCPGNKCENEFLLPRGSKFKINGISDGGAYGQIVCYRLTDRPTRFIRRAPRRPICSVAGTDFAGNWAM